MNLFLTLKKNAVRFVNAIDNPAHSMPIKMDKPIVIICVVLLYKIKMPMFYFNIYVFGSPNDMKCKMGVKRDTPSLLLSL